MLKQTFFFCMLLVMKINAEDTFKKLSWTLKRKRHGLWCSSDILARFKLACEYEELDFSPVLQDLMEQACKFATKPNVSFFSELKRKKNSFYCSVDVRSCFFEKCKEWRVEPTPMIEWLMTEYIKQIEVKHTVNIDYHG